MAKGFDDIHEILESVGGFARDTYEGFLDPLGKRFAFQRAPTAGEHRGDPMVLILGNHSSGKSTFINYMLEDEIQRTGLAPIDDGFTILSYGSDDEKDGPALVTNPELPFSDLERFGPKLISHLRLKTRGKEFLRDLAIVDTPGMIDAADAHLGRGYDFVNAVRWFVERADVVLVFFDPDKPGTTGETLKVFTSALLDIDHKLLIVLNKMDQFRTLRDFARAYGALCWNLSKVIPRKDLPMIYTTYVPVEGASEPALPLADFADARQEVVTEIRRAPARRVDNILTRLHEHSRRLRMEAKVCSAATRKVRSVRRQFLTLCAAAVLIGVAGAALTHQLGAEWYVHLFMILGGMLVGAGLYLFGRYQSRATGKDLLSGLSGVFESVYHNDLILSGAADDLRAVWRSVQDRAVQALETLGFEAIKPLSRGEERRLDEIIEKDIPALRGRVHARIRELAAAGKFEGPLPPAIEEEEAAEEAGAGGAVEGGVLFGTGEERAAGAAAGEGREEREEATEGEAGAVGDERESGGEEGDPERRDE